MLSTITERGQISIPAQIRKRFHLKAGMGMVWLEREDGIFLMPVPEDPIAAFQSNLKSVTSSDLLKQRKADRAKDR